MTSAVRLAATIDESGAWRTIPSSRIRTTARRMSSPGRARIRRLRASRPVRVRPGSCPGSRAVRSRTGFAAPPRQRPRCCQRRAAPDRPHGGRGPNRHQASREHDQEPLGRRGEAGDLIEEQRAAVTLAQRIDSRRIVLANQPRLERTRESDSPRTQSSTRNRVPRRGLASWNASAASTRWRSVPPWTRTLARLWR